MPGRLHAPGGHLPERKAEAKRAEPRQRSCRGLPVRQVGAHWPQLRPVLATLRRDFQNQRPVVGKQDF